MPELRDARHLLELAEQAAIDGDLSSADELLRDAARIQEVELGPLHPDLANTLTNLAIVAEKTGRLVDAETFYRRAAAIASASLPADHPVVAESRQNLEDFCRERGLPIAAPAVITPPAQEAAPEPKALAPEVVSGSAEAPAVPARSSLPLAWVAIGAVVLTTLTVLVSQPWSSRDTPPAAPTAAPATEPAPPPRARPAPIEQAQPPEAVQRSDDKEAVAKKRSSAAPFKGPVSLITVQLCQTFSTSGGRWRCDPAGDPVRQGPIVLYTRVKSSRDAAVVHRWYRENTLRQAVTLPIRANAKEGYRTYSRQTVESAGNWRVEVRSADGQLLHEQRFAVR